jgi:translation elongation factor EF-Tu-like GTPase
MFKINNIFQLTDRGQVIAGSILNGEIKSGDFIQILLIGILIELKIKSVESIRTGMDNSSEIGLIMESFDKDSIDLNDIVGQTATIIRS